MMAVLALALGMARCRKPDVQEAVTPSGTVSMTVTASPGRTAIDSADGTVVWSTSDKMYVSVNDGGTWKCKGSLTLNTGAGTATGTFTGTLTGVPTGEQEFKFFYLGSGNGVSVGTDATTVQISFAEQNVTADGRGNITNADRYHVGYGEAVGTVSGSSVSGINVTLTSKVAIAYLDFIDGETPYAGALTLSGTEVYNSMTVNFDGTFTGQKTDEGKISLTNTTSSKKYVMLVPKGAGAETIEVGGGAEGSVVFYNGIVENKIYRMKNGDPIKVPVDIVPVSVESVSLNKSAMSLPVRATGTLTATVLPADATNKNVTWSSSATGVATVSSAGVVTAVAAGEATITVTTVDGGKTATCAVVVGKFSVGTGTKVEFSPGSLWYDGSAFYFETSQTAYTTAWNSKHIDRFLWSPKKDVAVGTSTSVSGTTSDVFFTNKTQTTANPDFHVNGETGTNQWRTLSKAEWVYLLNTGNASSDARTDKNRFAKAMVKGVKGLLIFPDGYNGSTPVSGITGVAAVNSTSAGFPTSSVPNETWTSMESSGVVFLPVAGHRHGTGMLDVGSLGIYWSSTYETTAAAYMLSFSSSSVLPQDDINRYHGCSVRLVR